MKIDWQNLSFDIIETNSFIQYEFKNGNWDNGIFIKGQQLTLNAYASSLHYGQSCFEGLKAFKMKDDKIRIFRPELNARRLQDSCRALAMPIVTTEMFMDALIKVVKDNADFVPPFGVNGSLYIRPIVFATGGMLGLSPSTEYKFLILVNPVGDYYKGGMASPVNAIIKAGFDRAAPNGTGKVKVAGNYAPVMPLSQEIKKMGYTIMLFLDSKTESFIEEFSTSNFVALKRQGDKITYITPKSNSVLPSITNRSLLELAAKKFGWNVERRQISWKEVSEFEEVAACGTAVVITPIGQIDRQVCKVKKTETRPVDVDNIWENEEQVVDIELESVHFGSDYSLFKQLYQSYRNIQNGIESDDLGWMFPREGIAFNK